MNDNVSRTISRRTFGLMIATTCTVGCSAPWVKQDDKDNGFLKRTKEVKDFMQSDERPVVIGDAATITGLVPQQFEAFGLVHKLPGTGGDTRPSEARNYVLRELRVREVENPNAVIASDATAVVKLRANAQPGAAIGDRIDVIVQKSIDCEASDLRNGELMPTRLLDLVALDGRIRASNLKGIAGGQLVTVPPSLNSTKELDPEAAMILGGARVMDEQQVFIRMNDQVKHVMSTQAAADAINARFDYYDKNERKGIANAKTDRTIELQIPSKYRMDLGHFVDTVLSVGFMESDKSRKDRIEACRKKLSTHTSARSASLQLEAIGKEGIPALREALQNPDKEVRFYAAYSLAFLDEPDAIPILVELVRSEAAFRANGLIGLTMIDHPTADEALRSLLQDPEPEVCYGALRALRKRRSNDSMIAGQLLEGLGRITEVASQHPLVAVSLHLEPEIAVFGGSIPIRFETFYEVNSRMTMRNDGGLIRFAHFRTGEEEDLISIAEPNLRSVIQGFYDVKASYSDLIIFLDKASQEGWIEAPVRFNPLPTPGRKFNRITGTSETSDDATSSSESDTVKSDYSWWNPRRLWAD